MPRRPRWPCRPSSIQRSGTTNPRPPLLADFGLEIALRSYVSRFEEKHRGVRVALNLAPGSAPLPEPVQLAFFRIGQEALNNAAQHAGAEEVRMQLQFHPEHVALVVQDDGRGFVVPERWIELGRQGHLGLLGIAERTEVIGGKLNVISSPGAGTRLLVSVPCADISAAGAAAATAFAHPS